MSTHYQAFFGRTTAPAQSAIRFTGSAAKATQPSVLSTLREIVKKCTSGIVHVASSLTHAQHSTEQDISSRRLRDLLMLNRMADEIANVQPGLANELRLLACRD
ncbi:MAG TPA: hypothetical protein VJ577_00830 [Burkholderiaceae bacterium]|nr:hypothetical protein [Burkholderiaceae bacterium]